MIPFEPIRLFAFGGFNVPIVISLLIIGGGMLWLLIRSLKAKEVDRRIVFVFIFAAVSAPLLFEITFDETATPIVKGVFEKIENMPERSRIVIAFDFDPAMAPEVQPMANAVIRHALAKNHRLIFISLWATGQALMDKTISEIIPTEFPQKQDGIDYVSLGYKAGNEGVLNVIVSNVKKMFPTDVNGVPLTDIPIFNGVRSMKDVDMVMAVGGGKPGPKEWVLFVGDAPGGPPVAVGVAAVVAPQMYPYYPKQVLGILGGIKGAAEYESELLHNYPRFAEQDTPGLRMMGPQTLAHVVIMAFIIFGNLAFFIGGRHKEKRL